MNVRNPLFGNCIFDPGTQSLIFCNKSVSFNYVDPSTKFTRVNLETGTVTTASLDQTTLATFPLGEGERLRYCTSMSGRLIGFEILNKQTGLRRSRTELHTSLNRPIIVGNRYLVGFGFSQSSIANLTIVDAYAGEAVASVKEVPLQPLPRGLMKLERKPLHGTTQFAVELPAAPRAKTQGGGDEVVIFEIRDGEAREVARWVSGCSPANVIDFDNKLFSLSADAQHVEIRELPSLQLIETRRLRKELSAEWSRIKFAGGMGKVDNAATGNAEFFRLPDFERAEVPSEFMLWSQYEEPTRWPVLAHRTGSHVHYAVADREKNKLVFQRAAGRQSTVAMLDDHRLGICDLTSGLSIDVIDLSTGTIIKRLQPYAWLDWWLPSLVIVSFASCVLWVHAANAAGLSANLSILTLTTVVGGVALFGCVYDGAAWQFERPCVCYLFVVLTCMMFVSGWHAALGASHVARRWLSLIVSLCVVLQVITFLQYSDDDFPENFPLFAILFIVVPATISALLLWTARLFGLTWYRQDGSRVSAVVPRQLTLTDYFWLTASSGFLIMSLVPLRAMIWDADQWSRLQGMSSLLIFPLLAMIAFPTALCAVSRSRTIQRIMVVLMSLAAAYLVVDVTLLFWYGQLDLQLRNSTFLRTAIAMLLCSCLYFTAWRLDGWCLKWGRSNTE